MKSYYGKITINTNLLDMLDEIFYSLIDTSYIEFKAFQWNYLVLQRLTSSFKIIKNTNDFTLLITYWNGTTDSYTISSCTEITNYLTFNPNPFTYYGYVFTHSDNGGTENEMLYELRNYGFIEREENQEPFIYCYTLNSPKITVDKNLTAVRVYTGEFNLPVSVRDFVLPLEIEDRLIHFNYVYVSKLKRFYYIKNPTYIKNMVNLELHEDVLMTYSDLIKKQTAFVERNENEYSDYIVDDYVSMDYNKEISYIDVVDTLYLFEIPDSIYDVDGTRIATPSNDYSDFRYVLTVINAV